MLSSNACVVCYPSYFYLILYTAAVSALHIVAAGRLILVASRRLVALGAPFPCDKSFITLYWIYWRARPFDTPTHLAVRLVTYHRASKCQIFFSHIKLSKCAYVWRFSHINVTSDSDSIKVIIMPLMAVLIAYSFHGCT